ncbi:hypothetical protein TSUD_245440 [Trifolium subterraneum]|uniref:Uncharacterized protein n=1 Tax=Trifolium subterraneum TaxID=3900 RepID=A0A2Z6NIB8_TRISU|nr:hypothetical protein TSUD_245440 [Trifolium subterraneum]
MLGQKIQATENHGSIRSYPTIYPSAPTVSAAICVHLCIAVTEKKKIAPPSHRDYLSLPRYRCSIILAAADSTFFVPPLSHHVSLRSA